MTGPEGVQVIVVNGRDEVLLQLRDDDPAIPFPGMWSVPGGMIEDGETPHQCVLRELGEELGLTPHPQEVRVLWARQRSYGFEHTFWMRADFDPGELTPTEGQAFRFFSRAATASMRLGYEDADVLAEFHDRFLAGRQ
ncbi:NUDIX hydrolase [Micromonospora sp. RB23]